MLPVAVLVQVNGSAAIFQMVVRFLTPVWLRPHITLMDQWQYLLLLCALVPYCVGVSAGAIVVAPAADL